MKSYAPLLFIIIIATITFICLEMAWSDKMIKYDQLS